MRLIDADKITRVNFSGLAYIAPNDFVGMAKYFKSQLDAAPTVDAVPVVRCGECKFQNTKDCLMASKEKVMGYNRDQPFYTTVPSDLWYCYAGKRKDEDNNAG